MYTDVVKLLAWLLSTTQAQFLQCSTDRIIFEEYSDHAFIQSIAYHAWLLEEMSITGEQIQGRAIVLHHNAGRWSGTYCDDLHGDALWSINPSVVSINFTVHKYV